MGQGSEFGGPPEGNFDLARTSRRARGDATKAHEGKLEVAGPALKRRGGRGTLSVGKRDDGLPFGQNKTPLW